MNWIDPLIDNYHQFVRNRTHIKIDQSSEWAVIHTPFLDMFNDGVEVYVKKSDGKIFLSDDGITLKNLELCGINFNRSNSRREILDKILLNYGIRKKDNELVVEATDKNFPQQKLNLLSAIIEINDLSILAKHTLSSVFREDVDAFLTEKGIIFTPWFIAKGSTGLEFTFDFLIAGRKEEIVVKVFSGLNKTNLASFLFSWEDVKETRQKISNKNLIGLAVVNDVEKAVKKEYLDAFSYKGTGVLPWSKRYDEQKTYLLEAV
jgi:hypothetical protein